MVITREWVDIVCPEHGRTSCNDQNLNNSYGGWDGKFNPDTGRKVIHYPRCHRCYLLDNIGADTDKLEFHVSVDIDLTWKG